MKSCARLGKVVAVAALVAGAAACSHQHATAAKQGGAQPSAQQPSVAAASLASASATVQKIDKAKGELTLKGPEGRTLDVKVGPDVDLKRLHVGDTVTATYYDEVAVGIQKAAGAPRMTSTTVHRGGVTARQATVTARILSVDPSTNSVVIRGPMGQEHTLKVSDPGLQGRLKDIKPGESFDVTYTQAVAVSVEPQRK